MTLPHPRIEVDYYLIGISKQQGLSIIPFKSIATILSPKLIINKTQHHQELASVSKKSK